MKHTTRLKARTGLRRGSSRLKRSGPIKARKPKEKGNPAYRAFIRSFACHLQELGFRHAFASPTECAHVRTKRLARGRDNDGDTGNTIPLCHSCHMEQHAIGIRSFARKYGVDLALIASAYRTLWEARCA